MQKKKLPPDSLTKQFLFYILFLVAGGIVFSSCQPKAKYTVVDSPMNGFISVYTDTMHGAATLNDLACYLFIALKGDLTFNQFSSFIPDSADIARIYQIAGSTAGGEDIRKNADDVLKHLKDDFYETVTKATLLKVNWAEASMKRILVFEMESAAVPGKEITIESSAGKTMLRASVKCMQLDGLWFIGEDLRFGVR